MHQIIIIGERKSHDGSPEWQQFFAKPKKTDGEKGKKSIEVYVWTKEWEFSSKDTCSETVREQNKDKRCYSKIPEHEENDIDSWDQGWEWHKSNVGSSMRTKIKDW